jgi:riboflavin kinase/FMN adenylyltransferase
MTMPIRPPSTIVVEGVVQHGDERGRELGFPTANLAVSSRRIRQDGVWAGLVHLHGDRAGPGWITAVSVGRRPTFYDRGGIRLLEAHLIGFDGDLYDRRIRVALCERLRPMRAFRSAEALVHQLHVDVADTVAWATRNAGGMNGHQNHDSTALLRKP